MSNAAPDCRLPVKMGLPPPPSLWPVNGYPSAPAENSAALADSYTACRPPVMPPLFRRGSATWPFRLPRPATHKRYYTSVHLCVKIKIPGGMDRANRPAAQAAERRGPSTVAAPCGSSPMVDGPGHVTPERGSRESSRQCTLGRLRAAQGWFSLGIGECAAIQTSLHVTVRRAAGTTICRCRSPSPLSAARRLRPKSAKGISVSSAPAAGKCGPPAIRGTISPTASAAGRT